MCRPGQPDVDLLCGRERAPYAQLLLMVSRIAMARSVFDGDVTR